MATLKIDVTPELEQRLQKEAEKRGLAVSDYVRPALEALVAPQDALQTAASAGRSADSHECADPADTGASILSMVEEVWNKVPDEEMAKLPPDLSANLDH